MHALARIARRISASLRISGWRSADSPVTASVASGCHRIGLARMEPKSIGHSVQYTTSMRLSTSTTGLPVSSRPRLISVLAYSGSAQPRNPSGQELSSHAAVIAPAEDP